MLTIVPGAPGLTKVSHDRLHGEERPAQVDGDVSVEQLRCGVEERAPRGGPGRVDEAVDAPVALEDGGGGVTDLVHVGDVDAVVASHDAGRAQLGGQRLADIDPAAGHGDEGTLPAGGTGHGGPDSLRPTVDQHDLVLQQSHGASLTDAGVDSICLDRDHAVASV